MEGEGDNEEFGSKVLESKIIDMLQECGEDPPPFEDSDFPPDSESLYRNADKVPDYAGSSTVEWLRPRDISSSPDYFKATSGCGPIQEGVLDDAWLLGAMAAIAMHPSGLIENLFVSEIDDFKKYGVYTCRFYKDAQWIEVATDTRVPCEAGRAMYGASIDPNEMWIPLLEKAYAKLHRSYEVLNGGNIMEALIDCTGGSVRKVNLHLEKSISWDACMQYFMRQSVLCCQFKNAGPAELTSTGIIMNRLYIVLMLKEIGSLRFVKLKNPWSRGKWKGDWGNDDLKWDDNHQVESALQMDPETEFSRDGTDGTFWMVWEDFIEVFNELYITRLPPDSHLQYAVRGEWIAEAAAGPPMKDPHYLSNSSTEERTWSVKADSEPEWFRNPQYRITTEQPAHVLISLLQRDMKLQDGETSFLSSIHFLVLDQPKGSKGIAWEVRHVHAEAHSDPNDVSREISNDEIQLDPARSYLIVPYTETPKVEMEFFLRIVSSVSLTVQALPPIKRKVVVGSWKVSEDEATAGGPLRTGLTTGPENPSWCQNPQYWISFPPNGKKNMNVKIVVRKTSNKAAIKITAKNRDKNRAHLVGCTVLKPIDEQYNTKRTSKPGDAKVNFLGEVEISASDKLSVSPKKKKISESNEKPLQQKRPERRLVVPSDEWCRIAEYSNQFYSAIFLPRISHQWAPNGLLVVPTLGESNVEGSYELEVDTDCEGVELTELSDSKIKTLDGSWTTGSAGGCHLQPDWKKNPKFTLTLKSGKPIPVQITLSRSEKEWKIKCKNNPVGSMMGFYLFQGQKLSRDTSNTVTYEGRTWSETDFVPMHDVSTPDGLLLPPLFNDSYVIMPTTWEPDIHGHFLLSVKAECSFTLTAD